METNRLQKNDAAGPKAKVIVVLGSQFGDEGKGKLVDILASDADIVCRCQGGGNAGHKVITGDKEFYFRMLPSGFFNPNAVNVIGNGVVIHLPTLIEEIKSLEANGVECKGRLLISNRANIVFDLHQSVDGLQEARKGRIGTTRRGIGPTYSSKAMRIGVRLCELVGEFSKFKKRFKNLVDNYVSQFPKQLVVDTDAELEKYKELADKIRPMVCDTVAYLNEALKDDTKTILVEGAQGFLLDIDFGTYPYVTSSNTSVGGVCTGLGIPPKAITSVYGAARVTPTRIGTYVSKGALPTEINGCLAKTLLDSGDEITMPGDVWRFGWFDVVLLKYANMVNGFTSIALSKLDAYDSFEEVKIGVSYSYKGETLANFPANEGILSEVTVEYITMPGWKCDITQCRKFSELPPNAQAYVRKIEELSAVPVQWVGVGKSRDAMISVP